MKTTLDLPEDLLIEAKSVAARRRTTLKLLVENALRRELSPAAERTNPDPSRYVVGPFGILSLKSGGAAVSAERMERLIAQQHDEEDSRVLALARGKA